MKKKIEPQIHMEILAYEHKGITVRVKINYDNGHITLVDRNNHDKSWFFCSRGLEYMQGWQNILDAMKYAIGEATKRLETDQSEKTKLKEAMFEKVEDELLGLVGLKRKKW